MTSPIPADDVSHVPTPADAETPAFDEEVPPEAVHLSATLLWIFALAMLAVRPLATVRGKRDLGWFQEPWSWPFPVLSFGLAGGAIQPVRLYNLSKGPNFAALSRSAFDGMGRSLVYALSFLAYLGGVPVIGFTLASILYMQVLFLMSGMRGGKWPFVAFAVSIGIILTFRVGIGIRFPLPPFST